MAVMTEHPVDGGLPTVSLPLDIYAAHPKDPSNSTSEWSYTESRASTPDLGGATPRAWDEKASSEGREKQDDNSFVGIGLLPDDVYVRTMSSWRAAIRRRVRANVEWESKVIANMQERVRRPILDNYFVYTSSLGTHTFFMITLPAFAFFGRVDVARGLLMVLALGVYVASFVKDLVCAPRPFAPPVARLTMGNHHLEYGFPSTHSTNSVSIALFFFQLLHRLYKTPVSSVVQNNVMQNATTVIEGISDVVAETMVSTTTYYMLSGVLLFYMFSIVYGRLYTGMHSFTDCIMGVSLGAAIWALSLVCSDGLHDWIRDSGWIVPVVVIPLCLLLVHWHPQPIDDCPCFEDAIAFVSVIMGEVLSRWYMLHHGYDDSYFVRVMPGCIWGGWVDMFTWWSMAVVKMVLGILIIFMWRIFAKTVMHTVLPPIFRLLSQAFTLPHRRFYTPATDYKNVPPEKGLHPIPSVIDLPSMIEMEMDGGGSSGASLAAPGGIYGQYNMKLRGSKGRDKSASSMSEKKVGLGFDMEEYAGKQDEVVKHYDADVLTKVVVYSGIGMLACGLIPVLFEVLGWGL